MPARFAAPPRRRPRPPGLHALPGHPRRGQGARPGHADAV